MSRALRFATRALHVIPNFLFFNAAIIAATVAILSAMRIAPQETL
jgi:hypothetical protein